VLGYDAYGAKCQELPDDGNSQLWHPSLCRLVPPCVCLVTLHFVVLITRIAFLNTIHSLALRATPKGQGTMQAELLSTRRRSSLAPTQATRATAATAMVGVLALAVVLLRKGRVSKARLGELLAATVGGLLSSSCCAVQLFLNSISVGCAGFAVLDRFRPLFLCLTFSSLAYKTVAYDVHLHKNPWRSLPTWVVAVALASAPVVVRRLNRGGFHLGSLSSPSSSSLLGNVPQRPVMLQYSVRGMKCEACANGLKNALEALRGDLQADVLFEEGVVFLAAGVAARGTGFQEEGNESAASVLQALEEGIAEVMEERGYSYHSTEPSRERAASYSSEQREEEKEL